ncbi:hypothetical protein [Pleomorphomonas sp. JP5]|uniref:hypothetical protein n=1 Tax=Pleomorphomonas sp. JP5 TaxID=2942998 RepID=UPI0020432E14|nr:hypothetical protein [Pleomorphomonas sp. JP5]MCM5557346.1 hypothetical protein [Pleomorphomonas sp. JP5]
MTLPANLAALARRVVGLSADNLVALDEAGKLPAVPGDQLTGLVFTKDSGWLPEISIVAAGAFSVAHGLGVAPKLVQVWLRCKTAELNYAVGDMVQYNPSYFYDGSYQGLGLAARSSTIVGVIGASIPLLNLAGGSKSSITPASWRIVLRAFA